MRQASQIAYYHEPEKVRSEFGVWGLSTCEYFDNKETQAFIAGNNDLLLLAFRGTEENVRDWMADLDIDLVGGPGGKVHEGFITASWRTMSHA